MVGTLDLGVPMAKPKAVTCEPLVARPIRQRGKRGPADGRWYWRCDYRRKTVWCGWATREETTVILARIVAEQRLDDRVQIADVGTVHDLLDYWWPAAKRSGTRSESSLIAYRTCCRRICASSLRPVRLERLSSWALQQWAGEQLARRAPMTVRLDYRVLVMAWRWGRSVGACPDRDLPPLTLGRVAPISEKYTPTMGEVRDVLELARAGERDWIPLLLELQIATGGRVGEIGSLTWERVYAEGVELEGKTGRRWVPLPPALLQRLGERPRTSAYVLGIRPGGAVKVNGHLRRFQVQLGQKPWTTHALRRLAIDRAARAGVPPDVAAAYFGHSPEVMLRTYRQVSRADLAQAGVKARLWDLGGDVLPFRRGEEG